MVGEEAVFGDGGLGRAGVPTDDSTDEVVDVVVVSDTHAPRHWKRMPDALAEALADADHVLHAGDVCEPGVLDELRHWAPVSVAQGNNDSDAVRAWGACDRVLIELGGVRIAMLHDSGARTGRARRMHTEFPDADLVVFGHSHIPWHTHEHVEAHAFDLLNPGSVTDPRRQPLGSFVRLRLGGGSIHHVDFVPVARGAGRPLPTPRPTATR